jgi:hypothetical protein
MLKSKTLIKKVPIEKVPVEKQPYSNCSNYLSNVGKKWTDEEDAILLEELNKKIDFEKISQNHKRKIGGINARCKEIVYKMYLKNDSIKEIIQKTKLDYEYIKQIIDSRQNNNKIIKTKNRFSLESEIDEMKTDIKELKKTISDLSDMMKAVYDFEHT